jgi:hypothetical protein
MQTFWIQNLVVSLKQTDVSEVRTASKIRGIKFIVLMMEAVRGYMAQYP